MFVTVAICTWNRAALLSQTLAEFCQLTVPDDVEWELLVVNNKCTDNTNDVVAEFAERLPIRLLQESKQGLSHARNRAVKEARGEWILWTDDDVLVSPNWLEAYVGAIRIRRSASFLAGPIEAWHETTPPEWVTRNEVLLSSILIIRKPSEEVEIDGSYMPFGANLAFKTQVLRSHPFRPDLGRCGNGMLGGDETELIRRLLALGHQGFWVSEAVLRHFVPAARYKPRYIRRFFEGHAYSKSIMSEVPSVPTIMGIPRYAIRDLIQSSVVSFVLAPFRTDTWLASLKRLGYARGMIKHALDRRGEVQRGTKKR